MCCSASLLQFYSNDVNKNLLMQKGLLKHFHQIEGHEFACSMPMVL